MSTAQLYTKIELSIQCQKLVNKDVLSKSDPCVMVQMRVGSNNNFKWQIIGYTEMAKDDLSPTFNKTIKVDYKFEEQQPIRFLVYDIDQTKFSGKINTSTDEILGQADSSLGEICGSRGQVLKKKLTYKNTKNAGWIIVQAEEISKTSNDTIILDAMGMKLKAMDFLGLSDPYYILKRQNSDGSWQQIYKSEWIRQTLNPKWKTLTISSSRLCRGDENKKIRVEVWDWDKLSKDDYIGSAYFTVGDLKKYEKKDLPLVCEKKQNDKSRGMIRFNVKVIKNYTFFEYLTGGMEISLMVAIDFTGSNGNPNVPGTLHYHNPNQMNEYESAIRSIGDILSHYDSDNKFPTFGFGARLSNGAVSHCFALNGNSQNPECTGVNGILGAYHKALRNVQLYGPTYFSEILSVSNAYTQSSPVCQDLQKYYILLIITDGIINDMQKTIDAIVASSYQPLSVVIVGVGNADFSAMDQLDCDEGLLKSSRGQFASRDIVQFVPYSKFKRLGYEALAKETLKEIPQQVVQFFRSKKITPNRRPKVNLVTKEEGLWGVMKKDVQKKQMNMAPSLNNNWQMMKTNVQQNVNTQQNWNLVNQNVQNVQNQQQQQVNTQQQNWNLVNQNVQNVQNQMQMQSNQLQQNQLSDTNPEFEI